MTLPTFSRKLARLLPIALIAIPLSSLSAHASDIVYTINSTVTSSFPTGTSQTDTVVGTITTNGTLGAITGADIVTYSLSLIDDQHSANDFSLTTADSSIVLSSGTALTASATDLSFNFSGTGELLIQANSPGPLTPYHYFCLSTGITCYAGESITPNYLFGDGAVATGTSEPIGTLSLDQPVPEPSTYGLVLTGLLGIGGTVKRKLFS